MFTYILTNSENSGQRATRYVSGFSGGDSTLIFATEKSLDEPNALRTMQWGKLLMDGRYWEQGEKEVQNKMIEIVKVHKDFTSKQALFETIKKYSISEIFVDSNIISYASILRLQEHRMKVRAFPNVFQSIRETKTKDEIQKIIKAQQIALEAFTVVKSEIQVGVTEIYIAARLEFLMKQGGAEKVSFETIVASGANSALPHARSTGKKIEISDAVIIDFGAVYKGYCSDFTRTILMPKATDKLHEIYAVVGEAQQKALAEAKLGNPAKNVDVAARNYIDSKGYGKYFTHSTGHGVGMEVHELPHVSFNSEAILRKGHVITVEPGIYIPRVGGVRLEEMVIL